MHGLIFKIKESHRQDQSESFVIYVENVSILTNNIQIHLFVSQQSQMKSLHYDQCFYCFSRRFIYVRCFIETKQNQPTSWNKYIPVLSTTRLQAFKPKQASTDQPQGVDQQDVIEVSRAYVETFSTAFTSLPVVMFYYMRYRNSFGHANNMYDRNESRRSSFEQLSLQYTHINVHTAIPLH